MAQRDSTFQLDLQCEHPFQTGTRCREPHCHDEWKVEAMNALQATSDLIDRTGLDKLFVDMEAWMLDREFDSIYRRNFVSALKHSHVLAKQLSILVNRINVNIESTDRKSIATLCCILGRLRDDFYQLYRILSDTGAPIDLQDAAHQIQVRCNEISLPIHEIMEKYFRLERIA